MARLEKRKGHFFIIQAIKKLLPKFPNLKYIIAGSGSELNKLKKIVNNDNLNNNIIFVGSVNDEEKKFLFEKSNLMIMPTLDESKKRSIEGFGISYLEAAFFGVPSIASNIGGTPEAVIHESTGLIIKNIDDLYLKILSLLNNQKKLDLLSREAQKRAINEFDWKITTNKYLSLLNKIVNKK